MSTQIIPSQHAGFMDFSRIEAAIECCKMISRASFCPKEFRGKPEEVLCAIQYGMEIGLSPMQAIQSIAVINGKPSIYGDGLIGLCLSFSECEYINEHFDEKTMTAVCKVKRKGRPEVVSIFSKEKAMNAKLWGKDGPWKTYPERMLQMRARGFALRDVFADRLKGIIAAEEARDYPSREEKPINVVSPIKPALEIIENSSPVSKVEPILPETKNHLMFLMGELRLSAEIKAQWFNKLKISSLDELSESKAQHEIKKIEAKYPEIAEAWMMMNKARNEYQEEEAQAVQINS